MEPNYVHLVLEILVIYMNKNFSNVCAAILFAKIVQKQPTFKEMQ